MVIKIRVSDRYYHSLKSVFPVPVPQNERKEKAALITFSNAKKWLKFSYWPVGFNPGHAEGRMKKDVAVDSIFRPLQPLILKLRTVNLIPICDDSYVPVLSHTL
jgi:hypothetical protein